VHARHGGVHRDARALTGVDPREPALDLSAPRGPGFGVEIGIQARDELFRQRASLILGQREGCLENLRC
jgi:hypothetical protein